MAKELQQHGHEVSVLGHAVVLDAIEGSGLVGIDWPEDLLPQRFFNDAGPNGDFDQILDAWAHGVEDHGAAVVFQVQADALIGQLIGGVATDAVARKANVPWVFVNPAYYVGPTPALVTEDGPPWALVSLSTMPMADEADLANAAVSALLELSVGGEQRAPRELPHPVPDRRERTVTALRVDHRGDAYRTP